MVNVSAIRTTKEGKIVCVSVLLNGMYHLFTYVLLLYLNHINDCQESGIWNLNIH